MWSVSALQLSLGVFYPARFRPILVRRGMNLSWGEAQGKHTALRDHRLCGASACSLCRASVQSVCEQRLCSPFVSSVCADAAARLKQGIQNRIPTTQRRNSNRIIYVVAGIDRGYLFSTLIFLVGSQRRGTVFPKGA